MNSLLQQAKLFELSPDQVNEGTRNGFLHHDKATAIGRLMARDGQRDPIKVVTDPKNKTQPWKLVTGLHRLIGARNEGIKIWAFDISAMPGDLADLEASENLHRRDLAPIERAMFTAALVNAAQERIARENGGLKQQQVAVKARWAKVKAGEIRADDALNEEADDTCAKIAHVYGWEESVGEAMGMSRRTIHNDLSLYRLLIEPFPDLIRKLAEHPKVGENASQLKAIAAVKVEADRRKVIELLLANSDATADDALMALCIGNTAPAVPAAQHQKFFNQIEGGWTRLGLTQKREFLPRIPTLLGTPDLKRRLRDMLSEQLGDTPEAAPVASQTEALKAAFGVLAKLATGDVVEDEEIEAARAETQRAIWGDAMAMGAN